jgi:hypothetical protein
MNRPFYWLVLDNGVIHSAFVRRIDASRARDRWNGKAAADREASKSVCRRPVVGIARSRPALQLSRCEIAGPPRINRWVVRGSEDGRTRLHPLEPAGKQQVDAGA